jgi:hypothetical protein
VTVMVCTSETGWLYCDSYGVHQCKRTGCTMTVMVCTSVTGCTMTVMVCTSVSSCSMTVMVCISATGQAIPPFIIMKGIRQRGPTTEECLMGPLCMSLNLCSLITLIGTNCQEGSC